MCDRSLLCLWSSFVPLKVFDVVFSCFQNFCWFLSMSVQQENVRLDVWDWVTTVSEQEELSSVFIHSFLHLTVFFWCPDRMMFLSSKLCVKCVINGITIAAWFFRVPSHDVINRLTSLDDFGAVSAPIPLTEACEDFVDNLNLTVILIWNSRAWVQQCSKHVSLAWRTILYHCCGLQGCLRSSLTLTIHCPKYYSSSCHLILW